MITIVTATTGREQLVRCVKSVKDQTYQNIEHIVVADGPDATHRVYDLIDNAGMPDPTHLIGLPKSVGKDRYNGHRIYGAGTFLMDGDYIIFLDDDNWLEPTHVENCLRACHLANPIYGFSWAFSFRNIVDRAGNFLCQDNCESLGKWPSIIHPQDYFVDVNCYFLPRNMAVVMAPVWFCKFREPGQPEIDRKMMAFLRQHFPAYESTYKYSVNYTVGNTDLSVTPDFFVQGNAAMLQRYNGNLPWVKK